MIEPVRRTITVSASREMAFRRFTEEMGSWWPTGTHSVSGERCRKVRFESRVGGRILEVDEDGTEHVWGTVRLWDPPTRVAFSWHPGREPDTAQDVEVTFESEGSGTVVHLVHTGWEALGDAARETRDQYGPGWEGVLGRYAESVKAVAHG